MSSSIRAGAVIGETSGTWTPVLTFATVGDLNVVYSQQLGHYRKIGSLVVVRFRVQTSTWTFTTASGNLQITGLPFTSENIANTLNIGTLNWGGITKAGYTQVVPIIAENATLMTFRASGSAVGSSNVSGTEVPTTGTVDLRGMVQYFT